MNLTIPIFPLSIVAFPGEELNLHIFEERYKEMVLDCIENKMPFGLVPVINNKQASIGTVINILEVFKTYENGSMDIKNLGKNAFELEEFTNVIEGKLYPGGRINILEDDVTEDFKLKVKVLKLRDELYHILKLDPTLKTKLESLTSYNIAHKIGLSLTQELSLLQMRSEKNRLQMIHDHLEMLIPSLLEVEEMKRKVKLNGHFKHLTPPSF